MIIDVLGTPYTIKKSNSVEFPNLENCDGCCDHTSKTIVIDTFERYNGQSDALDNLGEYEKKVIRHELVHAFFFESGLSELANNEQIVDWIAYQFPKLLKAFEESNSA